MAIGSDPGTLNPAISSTNVEFYVEEAVFDGLLKYDARGRLMPDLAAQVPTAANGGISADLKTITYHLRRNVRWQDGKPFTARDVLFTYRLLMDNGVASPLRSTYEPISSVETPTPYTVVVHLRKPSMSTIRQVFVAGLGFIVPEHVLQNVTNIRHADFNSHPIGTGPFAVRAWKRGDRIELVANPRYFTGRPHIGRLELLVEPSSSTRVALVKTGAVDIASVPSGGRHLLQNAPVRLLAGASPNVFYVDLNTRRAPLDRRPVREALAYALDRPRITRALAFASEPAYALMPRASVGRWDPRADLGKADALLQRDGWAMTSSGVRMREGDPLHVELSYAAGPVMESIALQLAQAWKKIGVQTTLRGLPDGVLFGEHGLVVNGRFDAALDIMGVWDPSVVPQIVGSSGVPPAGFNYSRYANADVDRWLEAADATGDEGARSRLYARVHDALQRDVPVIPLFWGSYFKAVNKRVRGFAPEPIVSDLWNVASWSVE